MGGRWLVGRFALAVKVDFLLQYSLFLRQAGLAKSLVVNALRRQG